MPRLFTAIPVQNCFQTVQTRLPEVSWIDDADLHLTLKFIGDVSTSLANDIDEELRAGHFSPMTLEFSEVHWFGSGKPRVLYLGIKPTRELSELAFRHENLMRRLGLPAETRQFTPHVTLARVNGFTPAELMDYKLSLGVLTLPAFIASGFSLYSAKEKTGGGPYVRLIDYE